MLILLLFALEPKSPCRKRIGALDGGCGDDDARLGPPGGGWWRSYARAILPPLPGLALEESNRKPEAAALHRIVAHGATHRERDGERGRRV